VKRREFIALLGGAAAAWPVAARAQQGQRLRRIGFMMVYAEADTEGQVRMTAFRSALQEMGWTEGHNIRIDYRWKAGEPGRAGEYARDLLALMPDVILANGTPALAALQKATRDVPIVFVTITDPVGAGYVQSLSRPGANITGFSTFEPEIGGKWLELLKELSPKLTRVACIMDPGFEGFAAVWRTVEGMAPSLALHVTNVVLRDPADDIETALAEFAKLPGGGLVVFPTAINNLQRNRIFALAARHQLPAVYPFTVYATGGGLMSYGFDSVDQFRRAASYVDRILKGDKPADLPVQAPTKFELVINLQTAKTLGLTVPATLRARADEVIE
jgi:putative ABC transport system substrate-binding protein